MRDFIFNLLSMLASYGGAYGAYIGVVGVLILTGLGLPVPEDIPLLVGGLLCGLGHADIWVMLPLVFAAVLGGDLFVYGIGRRFGHHVPRMPLLRRYLTEQRLARAEQAFHAHGGKTLFTSRFLPGLRMPVFFTAGTFKVPFWKMLCFDGAAALISVPTITLVGYFGAMHFETVTEWTSITQLIVGGLVAAAAVGFILWKRRKRQQVAAAHQAASVE